MRIDLTEEQSLIKDSVTRFVAERYPFDRRQKLVATTEGYSEEDWQSFAELGWLGLTLPEKAGGLGMGALELGLLMEAFGRGLVASPYLATVLLGCGVVAAAGSPAQQAEILPAVAAGRMKLSLAFAEDDRQDPAAIAAKAERAGSGYILSGTKTGVPYAAAADRILVVARMSGRSGDASGLSFFLVDRQQRGLEVRDYPAHDGGRVAALTFDRMELGRDRLVGPAEGALPVLEAVLDHARAALCAEASGIANAVYEKTLAYFKTREQFGKLIGSFQALQHRLTDVYMKAELLQSVAVDAAEAAMADDPKARAVGVSAAKSLAGMLGREIGKEAVQLHGGIGMTWDYEAGHYLKRLTFIDLAFGDSHWHLERFRRLSS
jgi:alkylation response protein AidB-like acyl-CoA dehydrogenase